MSDTTNGGAASRRQALTQIVELADEHGIELDDIAAVLVAPRAERAVPAAKAAILTRLLAYLGGVFVFAGLAVFISMQWDEMGPAARVIITLGSGAASFVMAYVAAKDPRLAAAGTPLNVIAVVLQPLGILVALDEYSAGGDWRHASVLTSGIMLAQQLVAFVPTRRTVHVFGALLFGAVLVATLLDLFDASEALIALTVGGSLLCLAVGIRNTRHAAVTPFCVFVATALTLWGTFDAVQSTPIELVFVGAACGMVYLSTYVRSRSMLIVATLALLGYIGYFTAEHFVDTVGWPLALIAFGFAMIGLSVAAVTISRRYIRGVAASGGQTTRQLS
jgi:hypothetical protein